MVSREVYYLLIRSVLNTKNDKLEIVDGPCIILEFRVGARFAFFENFWRLPQPSS